MSLPRLSRHIRVFAVMAVALLPPGCGGGKGITIVEDRVAGIRFVIQPVDVDFGQVFSVSVELLDPDNDRATFATNSVTLSVSGGATLGGTLTVGAISGLATFNGLSVLGGGSGLRLTATSQEFSAQSDPFSVADPCQSVAGTVSVGQNVSGTLATSDCHLGNLLSGFPDALVDRWTLSLSATRNLQIDLSGPSLDAFLFVLDAQGTIASFNDDVGGVGSADLSSRILQRFAPGQYEILVTTTVAGQAGAYQLQVSEVGACQVASSFVFPDQLFNGSLAQGDCALGGSFVDYHYMSLLDPTAFRLTLSSTAFTPFAGADQVGGDHQISGGVGVGAVTLEHVFAPGDYWLFATSDEANPGNEPTGGYTLSTSESLPEPQDGCPPGPSFPTSVAGAVSIAANITGSDCQSNEAMPRSQDRYSAYLLAGESISVTMTGGFTYAFHLDFQGNRIQTFANVPANGSRTINHVAAAQGFYDFSVFPEALGGAGSYTLSFSEISGAAPPAKGARARPLVPIVGSEPGSPRYPE